MGKKIYTDEMIEFVRKLNLTHTHKSIAELFNEKFGHEVQVTPAKIAALKERNGIRKTKGRKTSHNKGKGLLKDVHVEFICKEAHKYSNQELVDAIEKEFGIRPTIHMVKHYKFVNQVKSKTNGRFKKGNIPWQAGTKGLFKPNRTSFKKGDLPVTTHPLGAEAVMGGILYVKTDEKPINGSGRNTLVNWTPKHRILWEEAYGEVPKKSIFIYKDGDRSNVTLDNLICIPRSEAMIFYTHGLSSDDPEANELGVEISRLIISKNKMKNGAISE